MINDNYGEAAELVHKIKMCREKLNEDSNPGKRQKNSNTILFTYYLIKKHWNKF